VPIGAVLLGPALLRLLPGRGRQGIAGAYRLGGETNLLTGQTAGSDRDPGGDLDPEQREAEPVQDRRHFQAPLSAYGDTLKTLGIAE
jgi:hypothetical protein